MELKTVVLWVSSHHLPTTGRIGKGIVTNTAAFRAGEQTPKVRNSPQWIHTRVFHGPLSPIYPLLSNRVLALASGWMVRRSGSSGMIRLALAEAETRRASSSS